MAVGGEEEELKGGEGGEAESRVESVVSTNGAQVTLRCPLTQVFPAWGLMT